MTKWLAERDETDSDVVVSSRVRLARNLANHRFTHRMEEEEAQEVAADIAEAVRKVDTDGAFTHRRLADVDRLARRVLMEQHLISPDLIKNRAVSEYHLQNDEQMTVMVNEEDHIRLQALRSGFRLKEAFADVLNMETNLEEHLTFAWHMEFGYLTACPTNTGTGLRASVMVHLPALKYGHQLKGLFDSLGKLGLVVRGIYGEGSEALGDMFQISNQRTLGFTEQEAIDRLNRVVENMVHQERTVRQALAEHTPTMVIDAIYRSLGILRYARVLSAREALQHLSHLRVGVALGYFQGVSIHWVDEMMLHVQKFTMLQYKHMTNRKETEDEVRADFIRECFEKEEAYGKW